MKLTVFTDYCMRVLIYLALQPQRRATVAEVAEHFALSVNHMTKVAHFLGKQGWLVNVRGKGGGMRLAREAGLIGVGAVVRASEGRDHLAPCSVSAPEPCVIATDCRLRGAFSEAAEAFYGVLDRYTVADLVRDRAVLVRLLKLRLPALT